MIRVGSSRRAATGPMALAALAATALLAGPANAQHSANPHDPHASPHTTQHTGTPGRDPAVEKLKAAAIKLDARAKSHPRDAALKIKAAEAYFQSGHAAMYSEKMDRKVKYRDALRDFRRALALNPKHAQAASEKQLIESIYKQMKRPIPG